jgi:N-acetylmuramoyl-L-alanine amidase
MQLENSPRSLASIVVLTAVICLSCSSSGKERDSSVVAQRSNANHNQEKAPTGVNQNQAANTSTAALPNRPRPRILSRQEWNAKDSIGKMRPHTLQHITIHHTASPQKGELSLEKKMQSLQNFSQSESRLASGKHKPAWPDIPYHYYIAVDGQIAEGRDLKYVGDTNTDYDPTGHALIVLEGNFEKEQPSPKQLESLSELVAWLSTNFEIPIAEIKAHNDYASTACPGVNLKNALPALRQKVAEIKGMADER